MTIRSKKQLDARIDELNELQAKVNELNSMIESIKDDIKKYMGDKEEVLTENYKVRYTKVVSTRFDSKSLEKYDPEVYKKYLTESSYRRFSIN